VPAAAVLHFAASEDRIPYLKIKKLTERQPEGRALSWDDAQTLIEKSEGDLHRWLVFIFYQGWRVTESLSLTADNIDFAAGELRVYVSKIRRWKTVAMHDETAKVLQGVTGKAFPWRDRHHLYDALMPFCKALGIRFTPHMARHTFGTQLNAKDASPRDIVMVGTWRDPKSVMRYTEVDSARGKSILDRLTAGGRRGKINDA